MQHECLYCEKNIRKGGGIKCDKCESKCHPQCIKRKLKEFESGDKRYRWVCARCKNPASRTNLELDNLHTLLNAIDRITEKFEVVNKIQLPKLNNDLLHVKLQVDRLVKQNDDMLLNIDLLRRKSVDKTKLCSSSSARENKSRLKPSEDQTPTTNERVHDKLLRYRIRRRSYSLLKLILQLNRKLIRRRVLRKKQD